MASLIVAGVAGAVLTVSADSGESPLLPSRAIAATVMYAMPDDADWSGRIVAAQRWVADFAAWQEWDAQFHNTPEPGWFHARPRRRRPDPPAWLAGVCLDGSVDRDALAGACRSLVAWRDDAAVAQLRRERTTARLQKEAPTRTVWWEHIHVDGLWPMAQWNSGVFGVLGMHASVDMWGRLQVFVAPGAIVLNLPNGPHSREWKPATDWGIGYRLVDFAFSGTARRATLNLNIAKAWVLADATGSFPGTVDLAGFSVTFKQTR